MDTTALLCNICPKRPKFSDISHLLTHVASKAHLSHYFKLQVRSHQESQAIVLLDEYDRWYKSNNLAKLLSDRMSSKDVRKKKTQEKTPSYDKARGVKRGDGRKLPPTTARPLVHNAFPEYLDPRLSSPFVHPRCGIESGQPSEPSHFNLTAPLEESVREYQREDYSLALTTPQQDTCPPKQGYPLPFEDQWAFLTHASPYGLARKPIHRTATSPPSLERHLNYDPFTDDADGIEEDKERADEIARLKGVLWPGMDIFDSATEHMRRKRNQKKDEAILRMMEKTSLRVEPTELVFSPSGILRKQRVISGNVDDSSPLKGETPIPKRRIARTKRALAQADPNVRQGGNRKRSKRSIKKALEKVDEDPDFHGLHLLQSPLAQLPVRHRSRSRADSLDDFTLTFRTQESRSHHGLKIFQDGQTQYMPDSMAQRYGEVGSEGSGFVDPVSLRQGTFDPTSPHYAYNTDHPIRERGTFGSTDKENVEPLLDGHGRVGSLGWDSPVFRRQPAANTGYPPHVFFGDSQQQMGLSPFDSHDSLLGYSYNPLATSLSNIHEDNPIYSAEVNQPFKSHSTLRLASPEGTISDLEEDDFDRLYLDGSIN